MGIDAEMLVRVKREVPDDEVRALRMALGGAFGAERFSIFRAVGQRGEAPLQDSYDPETGWTKGRHLIERSSVFEQDGPSIEPEEGETLLRVHLATRFYGIGYERGDLPTILSVARFLRDKTGGEVWYGGDSSGVCARLLDDAFERELWDHFVAVQHEPYYKPDMWGGDNIPNVHCAFCNHPMRRFGSGSNGMYAPFYCRGCGARVVTNDGGVTWAKYDGSS